MESYNVTTGRGTRQRKRRHINVAALHAGGETLDRARVTALAQPDAAVNGNGRPVGFCRKDTLAVEV